VQDIAHEVVQTLDFTKLERGMLAAAIAAPPPAAGAKPPPPAAPDAGAVVESTQHLRLLECIRETVFQTDLAGTVIYLNERWTKISGYSCEETVRKPLAQFFVAEDQVAVTDHLGKVARGEAVPVILEARLARKGGEPLKIAMRAAPLSAASGPTVGVCGTLRGMA